MRLQNAEARLTELKSTMMALGKEATTAMQSVEAQQQQVTYERLRTMVLLHFILLSKLSCYSKPYYFDYLSAQGFSEKST